MAGQIHAMPNGIAIRRIASVTLLAAAPGIVATALAGPGLPDSEAVIDEIVVVASKQEQTIRDVAADVVVVDADAIGESFSASLAEAFRYTPGIDFDGAGTRFASEGVSIRGIGGNRVAIEFDGVPVSDQFDVGRFANATRDIVDAGLIGRVEVLRGPASALYGSKAIGGVVAMRSPDPHAFLDGRATRASLGAGVRGVDDGTTASAMLAGDAGALSLLGAYVRHDGEERDSAAGAPADDVATRRDAALLKLVAGDVAAGRLEATVLRQDADTRSDLRSLLGTGRFASTTALLGDDSYRYELASLRWTSRAMPGVDALGAQVYAADSEFSQFTLDERRAAARPVVIERRFDFAQRSRGIELQVRRSIALLGLEHDFALGAEWSRQRVEERRDGVQTGLDDGVSSTVVLGETFPLRDFPVTGITEFGAWFGDEVRIGPLSVIGALRFDESELDPRVDVLYAERNPDASTVALSRSDVSPKLGIVYRPLSDVDVYLQYARGFRAPPFEDANIGLDIPLFNVRAIPNPELESETSDGWDLGLRWYGLRASAQLGLFRTEYRDFIETKARVGVDPIDGRLLFQSINIDEAVIEGVEARWSGPLPMLSEAFRAELAAYYARGRNRVSDEPLNSVGPPEAVLALAWRSADERASIRLVGRAARGVQRRDESGGPLFRPAGYGAVDVFATQRIGRHWLLRIGAANLTDREFWHWSAVRGLAPDDPALPVLAEPGRHYSLSVHWSL